MFNDFSTQSKRTQRKTFKPKIVTQNEPAKNYRKQAKTSRISGHSKLEVQASPYKPRPGDIEKLFATE